MLVPWSGRLVGYQGVRDGAEPGHTNRKGKRR
jgi:hypothetical protein